MPPHEDEIEIVLAGTMGDALFKLMEVCTEEANEAGGVSSALWEQLYPPKPFRGLSTRVYRSHVKELIARHQADEHLDLSTEAEVMLMCMQSSQLSPLTQRFSALYHYLFRRIMGDERADSLWDGGTTNMVDEMWEGQIQEDLFESRKKMPAGRPKRVLDA